MGSKKDGGRKKRELLPEMIYELVFMLAIWSRRNFGMGEDIIGRRRILIRLFLRLIDQ